MQMTLVSYFTLAKLLALNCVAELDDFCFHIEREIHEITAVRSYFLESIILTPCSCNP